MKSAQSTEDFNSCGDSNNYGCGSKIGTGVYIYSHGEYVVSSNDKSQDSNSKYGINYTKSAKGFFFAGLLSNNM